MKKKEWFLPFYSEEELQFLADLLRWISAGGDTVAAVPTASLRGIAKDEALEKIQGEMDFQRVQEHLEKTSVLNYTPDFLLSVKLRLLMKHLLELHSGTIVSPEKS